jgi:5-methylthioadenosine/S-adenosylhomocysteine deaminase
VRTLYSADFVVSMDADNTVIPDGAVLVEGDRIVAAGSRADLLAARDPSCSVVELPGRLLMPGLINTHTHSGLLRGAARAAAALGNRLVVVSYTGAHPDFDYFDTLDDNERLLREWHGGASGRIDVWVGLEHPFYFDAAGMARAIAMAREYGTGLYTHCSESRIEPPEFEARYGARPMFALERLGFFTAPKAMIAHGVWLDSAEIALLAQRGAGVAHNPVSNMKLASGMAPVEEYLAAGVSVGLGTDGEKENNNLDMFEELKTASL